MVRLVRISWFIGRWKSERKQARDVRGRCIDSLKFFRITLDETIMTNTYFVAPFYCSRQLIHSLEISGNKNNLRILRG